ncbi:AP2/B3-like transcriptional factor family protein, partial [Prunus dulcis]
FSLSLSPPAQKQPPELLFTAAVFGPPPPHPATTWGGTGPKRTVPSSSSHPDQSQPPEPPVLAGKCENPTGFNPKLQGARSLSFLLQIRRVRYLPDFGIYYKHHQVKVRSRVA